MKDEIKKRMNYAREEIMPALSEMLLIEYIKEHKLLRRNDNTIEPDMKADNAAIEKVLYKYPEDSVITEESYKLGKEYKGKDYKWIMDLLDGSSNFRKHIPVYATSIALEKEGELYGGMVQDPDDKLYYASKGKGAFCLDREKYKMLVSKTKNLSDANISTVSSNSFKRHGLLGLLSKIQNAVGGSRQLGCTSLEFAYTAKGDFDAIVKPTSNPWGVSAGIVLVTEAGGRVKVFNTEKTNIYVASNPHIHDDLCAVVENYLKKKNVNYSSRQL